MNKTKFKEHVSRLKKLHEARIFIATYSQEELSEQKNLKPTIKVSKEHAWYICYVYSECASCFKVKKTAIKAMNQFRRYGNKKIILHFVKRVGLIHGVKLLCDWGKL